MNKLWQQRIFRIWVKTILLFFLTLFYLFFLGIFWNRTNLPLLLSFLLVSIWYMSMIFLIEYYIRTTRYKNPDKITVNEINEEENQEQGDGDIDILFGNRSVNTKSSSGNQEDREN